MRSIRVGLIGVGPNWESRYRPALQKLHHRIAVQVVFDHVYSRAESVAKSFEAQPIDGVLALADRSDLDAILVLDSDWHGTALLDRLCSKGKPIYLSQLPADGLLSSEQLHSITVLSGTTVMPQFEWRYEPSSARLQELIASRLGRPTKALLSTVARFPSPDEYDDRILKMLDWCCYLARTAPESLSAQPDFEGGTGKVMIQFRQPKSGDHPLRAELEFLNRSTDQTCPDVACRVFAALGQASFSCSESIEWSTESESASEMLEKDRSAVEVMLDHFCRRVVGGLIPVPDLGDVCTALRLRDAIRQSLESKQTVKFTHAM